MSSIDALDDSLRSNLESLADALLPLVAWVNESGKYVPPGGDQDLPWRHGTTLNARQLQVVAFLEALIAESSGDADLLSTFAKTSADPLRRCPIDDVRVWRGHRGLDPVAEFGIVESENVLIDITGKPISRIAFYQDYLPLFKEAVAAAQAKGNIDWADFATKLLGDGSEFWKDPLTKSSVFVLQFAKDVLYAVMGMRNTAPPPWNRAVLVELGERRFFGNKYTPDDAAHAVADFQAALQKASQLPAALSIASAATPIPPPVGSPPATTKPEHL